MNTQDNGRKVTVFRAYDRGGNPHDITVGGGFPDTYPIEWPITDIFLSATYHGDHDEFWIVAVTEKEERRYNCKAVDFFELSTPPEGERE